MTMNLTVLIIFLIFVVLITYIGSSRKDKDILKLTNDENYPTTKVILSYLLLGGGVGGFIIAYLQLLMSLLASFTVFSWLTHETLIKDGFTMSDIGNTIGEVFGVVFIYVFFGSILGCIPAVMVGIWLTVSQTIIQAKRDFLIIFAKVLLTVMLVSSLIAIVMVAWKILWVGFLMGLLCALSAVIVGWFVLPRSFGNE